MAAAVSPQTLTSELQLVEPRLVKCRIDIILMICILQEDAPCTQHLYSAGQAMLFGGLNNFLGRCLLVHLTYSFIMTSIHIHV